MLTGYLMKLRSYYPFKKNNVSEMRPYLLEIHTQVFSSATIQCLGFAS